MLYRKSGVYSPLLSVYQNAAHALSTTPRPSAVSSAVDTGGRLKRPCTVKSSAGSNTTAARLLPRNHWSQTGQN